MNRSRACCVAAIILLGGCAARDSYRPESEVIAQWLSARPRALALQVDATLPAAQVRTRDPQTAKKIAMVPGGAIAGVFTGIWEGCLAGGLFGCVVGVVVSPVTAVVGAVYGSGSVQPIDAFGPPAEIAGVPGLFEELHGEQVKLAGVLRESLEHAAQRVGKHKLVRESDEGALAVSISELMFSRDVGDESKLGLVLGLRTEVRGRVDGSLRAAAWHHFMYEGRRRTVAEWMADHARPLREEVATAATALATQVIAGLDRAPAAPAASRARRAAGSDSGRPTYPRLTKSFITIAQTEAVAPFPAGTLVLLEHTIAVWTESQRAAWLAVNLARPSESGQRSFSGLVVVDCKAGTMEVRNSAASTSLNGDFPVQDYEVYEPPRQIAAPVAALLSARDRICSRPDPYRATRP